MESKADRDLSPKSSYSLPSALFFNEYNQRSLIMITQEELKRIFRFDPETGLFTRKSNGKTAKKNHSAGYIQLNIYGKIYLAHRLVFLYMYGTLPSRNVDHINGDKTDNRPANLRDCDQSTNMKNACIRKDNKSGHHGISWNKRLGKWHAYISTPEKRKHIGFFEDIRMAICAREKAEREHNYHINHGRAANVS